MGHFEKPAGSAEAGRPSETLLEAAMFGGSLVLATVLYRFGAEINSFLSTSGIQVLEQFFHDAS